MKISDWKRRHQTIKLLNQRVSFIDSVVGDKVILVIHGFGMSSFDYHKVIDELKLSHRIMIPDLIGFGLSSKPSNFYFSLIEHAQILLKFLEVHHIKQVSIVAQGFGASVLCEMLSSITDKQHDLKIEKIWLLNLSLSVELSPNYLEQQLISKYIVDTFLKISSSYEMFKKYIEKNFYDKNNITENELSIAWYLMHYNQGIRTINFIDYWLVEIQKSTDRWLETLKKSTSKIELIWGMDQSSVDITTPTRIQNFLHVDKAHLIADCGYFTMLEKPSLFVEILKGV